MAKSKKPKRSRGHKQAANKTKSKKTGDVPTTEAAISELSGDTEAPTDYGPIEGPRPGR